MKKINQYIIERLRLSKNDISNNRHISYRDNWSILNAENGDIVKCYSSGLLFIYKGLNKDFHINNASLNAIVYHAFYINDDRKKVVVKIDTGVGTTTNKFLLASEEEQDEFYQALEKNGYRWDENKLEIVKI